MLTDIQVSDFAIIESLHIEFDSGLNILSGETGAGKSIILKSLALLMGEKGQADTVRAGAKQASIEGRFDITDREDILERLFIAGIDAEDGSLVVKRVIGAKGNSKVYINGSLSTVSTLRDLVSPLITVTGHLAPLIEMTGQHDNRHLQSKTYHLDCLDQFAECFQQRTQFGELYQETQNLIEDLNDRKQKEMEREQRLDFLSYQVEEIESLELKSGEEDSLERQFRKVSNASKMIDFVGLAEQVLDVDEDSSVTRIQRVLSRGAELERLDPELSKRLSSLNEAITNIEAGLYELRHYVNSFEVDDHEKQRIEERISAFKKLQKKHGQTADEILEKLMEMKSELHELQDSETFIANLEKQIARNQLKLKAMATDLHEARCKASSRLAKLVNEELLDLNMKGVEVLIEVKEIQMNSKGASDVEFMIKSAKSDTARPITKFASGGELSRILLSLKRVIGDDEHPRTYLFDEVDTGVSGPTAEKVGRKLLEISEGQQVICVTHLPQVAAFADHHFLIEKASDKNSVSMSVSTLNEDRQIEEIARLISGEKITKTSRAHAVELISEARG